MLFDPGTFSSFDDVKGVDAIVVTHQHADHLDPGAIDSLRAENDVVVIEGAGQPGLVRVRMQVSRP